MLKKVAAAWPGQQLHVVCDNYATQNHPGVGAWLAQNPRVALHFTPTGVLPFFSIITRQAIRRGTYRSVRTSPPASASSSTAGTNSASRSCGPNQQQWRSCAVSRERTSWDRYGRYHGLRGRVVRTLQRMGHVGTTLAIYDEALRKGDLLLPVPARPKDRSSIAALLQRHGVHDLGYIGPGRFEQFPILDRANPDLPGTAHCFGGPYVQDRAPFRPHARQEVRPADPPLCTGSQHCY